MITDFTEKELYRYDLAQPPTDLSTSFLSIEYEGSEHVHKNQTGLFFFTDSSAIAEDLGKVASEKKQKSEYFITQARAKNLRLIDFSQSFNIYQMLCVLKELNIDCLTTEFRTYEGENVFSTLKPFFDNVEAETNPIKKMALLNNLKVHSKSDIYDISLFGQRLTDFKNGLEFKDNRGLPYCLFNADKFVYKEINTITESK